jgi:hypothetical protein
VALRVVAAKGVPEITPFDASVRGLILPETIDQVIGELPVAVRVWEYAAPTVPELRLAVVIVGAVPPPPAVLGAPKVGPEVPVSRLNAI